MLSISKEARINLAINTIRKDARMSIRKAAKHFHIPPSSLHNRFHYSMRPQQEVRPPRQKLTEFEEETIVERIIDLDSRAFPPRLRNVEEMANLLLRARDAPPVGKNWASNFVRRRPELKTRFNRKIDYQRIFCEDPDAYRAWFRLVEDTIAKHGILAEDIYNFDETGFMMGMILSGMVVTSAERRGRPRQAQQGDREWATVIQAVCSDGYVVPAYIILAGKTHLASWTRDNPLPPDWRIAITSNGWTTNDKGLEWTEHFNRHTKDRTKGTTRLLILDGHESHHSAEFDEYCKANNIIPLCMPAHSSHRLQPLDVTCFSVLKKAYSDFIEGLMRRHQTHVAKEDFLRGFYIASEKAMTPETVRSGFRAAGLVPLDPQSVISALDISYIAKTPSPEPDLPTTPWITKTPTTIKEATSQSVFIKNKISNHQNSSPTAILEACTQFSKATYKLLHKVALLKEENSQLRETNHILSKRRRTKNKQLQSGGSLTIAESNTLRVQREGNGEVVEEEGESSRPRKRARGGSRRCGICGNTGHNARTCSVDVDSNQEEDSD